MNFHSDSRLAFNLKAKLCSEIFSIGVREIGINKAGDLISFKQTLSDGSEAIQSFFCSGNKVILRTAVRFDADLADYRPEEVAAFICCLNSERNSGFFTFDLSKAEVAFVCDAPLFVVLDAENLSKTLIINSKRALEQAVPMLNELFYNSADSGFDAETFYGSDKPESDDPFYVTVNLNE